MKGYYMTAESVTEGHPDKICDQISDGILDEYLKQDAKARVAIETMVSKNTIVIAGEVTSGAEVNIPQTARNIVRNIGYTHPGLGFDYQSCIILTNMQKQSADIALGVDQAAKIGGGDQGIMYGYACAEAPGYMPMPCYLANQLTMQLARVRKEKLIPWLYPDGKAQVTMKYGADDKPHRISSIVLSAQHEDINIEYLRSELMSHVIETIIEPKWLDSDTRIHINPTGRFVTGGPAGDTGVTGRKIMVDTYGGIGKHGGGAFSGKDPTKVDRSAAYMARYAAKNIVAAGLAEKCEVQIAYVIGKTEPEAVSVQTFGTEKVSAKIIEQVLNDVFSFAVSDIIEQLFLRNPQYLQTAAYGHFGRENNGFAWERIDKVTEIKERAAKYLTQGHA